MTEKRFKKISVCGDWGIKDVQNDKILFFATTDEVNDTWEVLNELHEENKELKAKVDDKEVAVEVECEKLMQKVFTLIDKSLEKDKHYYEMSYESYLNGRIEALEDLKKELSE